MRSFHGKSIRYLKRQILYFLGRRRNWSIPYILFLAFFVIVPLVLIVFFAFTNNEGHLSLMNFRKFWMQPEAMNTFIYSVGIAMITTAICLLLGYPAAFIMSRMKSGLTQILVILFILPMWVNFLIRTLATVAMFDFLHIQLGLS